MNEGRVPPEDSMSDLGALSPGEAFRIALPNFEGPLDLLLHLIREHRVDIFDIPVALITEKYLQQLEKMREINLDIAGEFLVMASTLAHIKSRMLLPRQEMFAAAEVEAVDERDPRAELVRRLLEYQKYKEVARTLAGRHILDRDVFAREVDTEELVIPSEEAGLMELSIYKLIEALDRVLKERLPDTAHEVIRERVSLSAAMTRIIEGLKAKAQMPFFSLFDEQRTRQAIIITFLALLELVKLKLVRVRQPEGEQEIFISAKEGVTVEGPLEVDDEYA